MPLFPVLTMLTFPQQLTQLTSRIPGYIYLWLAIPIFGSSSALTRKITEIGAEHFVGSIVAFTGVVLTIVLQTDRSNMTPVAGFQLGLGELMAVSGAICLSIATIVAKKHLTHVPLGIHNTVRTGLGTIVYFGLALWMYGFDHFMDVLSPFLWQWMLLYGTVIVVIGQSLWNIGFRTSSIATASLIGSFAPIVGVLAAYFILGEVPTQAQYIGGVVILVGLFLGQLGIRARTNRLKSIGISSMETEQEIEGKMGFKGI